MIIEFKNLEEVEKELLYNIGDNYADEVMVREIIAGIDSETAMQLILTMGPTVIAAVSQLICKIIDSKENNRDSNRTIKIFVVLNNGSKIEINNIQDFNEMVNNGK